MNDALSRAVTAAPNQLPSNSRTESLTNGRTADTRKAA
jgi:hypothetical protein